ncbi:hypothetical protein [Vibrio hangzhouensis]|uniref:hypothetical protein n=1 Tax=Vibrio hangzhouensis TaxID=462991 RepID=UPI001C95B2CA|nr:hypothetical protein [Vibrio hangzhouensis]MBY6197763.1 hypothetical protein [Vibrio hangzhouensis]
MHLSAVRKTWITLLTVCALLASTLAVSMPAMAFSSDMTPASQHSTMMDCGSMADASENSHHTSMAESSSECADSDSMHSCCSATCANSVGVISADLMHGIHVSLYSKRVTDVMSVAVSRITDLERPPQA